MPPGLGSWDLLCWRTEDLLVICRLACQGLIYHATWPERWDHAAWPEKLRPPLLADRGSSGHLPLGLTKRIDVPCHLA